MMHGMKRKNDYGLKKAPFSVCLFLAGLFTGTFLSAADVSSSSACGQLTLDQILKNHIEAIGGEKAWKDLFSVHIIGEITGSFFPRPSLFEYYAKVPNKRLTITQVPTGKVLSGFDGREGWMSSPLGITVLQGEELEQAKRDADFYRDLRLKKLYPDLRLVGTVSISKTHAYVLEAHPTPKLIRRFFIDCKTFYLIREEAIRKTRQGAIIQRVDASDFRKEQKVVLPHKLVMNVIHPLQGETKFQIIFVKVEQNVSIPDSRFEKPEKTEP